MVPNMMMMMMVMMIGDDDDGNNDDDGHNHNQADQQYVCQPANSRQAFIVNQRKLSMNLIENAEVHNTLTQPCIGNILATSHQDSHCPMGGVHVHVLQAGARAPFHKLSRLI